MENKNKHDEGNEEEILKELGFSSLLEFVLYHWNKLPERSRNRLKAVGIFPKEVASRTETFKYN